MNSPTVWATDRQTVRVPPPISRLLLARHGETEWNRVGRRQGQLDSPLTVKGKQDAKKVAELSRALGGDAVFSSPLGRARATAEVIGLHLSLPVVVLEDLAEIDHGVFSGLTNSEIEMSHPGELARRATSKYTWRFPGGESYKDAESRALSALESVAESRPGTPVLVTHEMIGRMLLRRLLQLSPSEALERSLPHGSVLELHPGTGGLGQRVGAWP